jgi:hypothetical protein
MSRNNARMGGFRRFLTAQHPTKYLVCVLIGTWMWLWVALDRPPVLTYLGYTLLALVFFWTRPFSALRSAVDEHAAIERQDQGQKKRGFLYIIAAASVLPIVFTLRADPRTGALIFALVCLATVIYILLMPGATIPRGWITKRWSHRKKDAGHR